MAVEFAPHTGAPMFSMAITVGLRADFLDYCDDLNLDATFDPARG